MSSIEGPVHACNSRFCANRIVMPYGALAEAAASHSPTRQPMTMSEARLCTGSRPLNLTPAPDATRRRRHPRGLPPAPPLLDPCRDRLRVGPGQAAQGRGLPAGRLVKLTLARALKDAGDLGEQVGAAASELAEPGHRGAFPCLGQLALLRVMPRLASDLSDEQAASLRALIDHEF